MSMPMPEWWPRCQGCGAPVQTERSHCAWCGRVIPWEEIIGKLPPETIVLYADGIPVVILP